MCAGAMLEARLSRLVFAARNMRLGAAGSWVPLLPTPSTADDAIPSPAPRQSVALVPRKLSLIHI